MKSKLLTILELEEKVWWWKCKENLAELERLNLFGYELAARNYELMRRTANGSEYERTYLNLNRRDNNYGCGVI